MPRSKEKDASHLVVGKAGEDLAVRHLVEEEGYVVIGQNYRTPMGEIDIVARDAETLVFIEVRTKKDTDYGDPFETINAAKIRRIVRAAGVYLAEEGQGSATSVRFDAVGVVGVPPQSSVRLLKGAFDVTGAIHA